MIPGTNSPIPAASTRSGALVLRHEKSPALRTGLFEFGGVVSADYSAAAIASRYRPAWLGFTSLTLRPTRRSSSLPVGGILLRNRTGPARPGFRRARSAADAPPPQLRLRRPRRRAYVCSGLIPVGWADVRLPEIVLGFLLATAFWALCAVLAMPDVIVSWLHKWQTLVGAMVALFAAGIAFRSLRQADELEKRRRSRKHAAIRAVLPLALAQVTEYAERTLRALDQLVNRCEDEILPRLIIPGDFNEPLSSETLETLAAFIEYSDALDVRIVEELVSWIQKHNSRLSALAERNRDPIRFILKTELMARVIDAACIYTAGGALFAYARRRDEQLPLTVSFEQVEYTLMMQIRVWSNEYQKMFLRREQSSEKPFEEIMMT